MNFIMEVSKTGKTCIVFNDYKFREGYSAKCGDITWRCLGKTCNATFKTDAEKKKILSTSIKHTGHHPVTLRSLSSPSSSTSSHAPAAAVVASPSASAQTNPHSTPSVPSLLPLTNVSSSPETEGFKTDFMTCSTPAKVKNNLQEENLHLRKENTQLKEEVKVLLEHSIESDTRLLQHTKEIFVANVQNTSCQTGVPSTDTSSSLPLADNNIPPIVSTPHDTTETTPSNRSKVMTTVAASDTSPSTSANPTPSTNSITVHDSAQDYSALISSLKTTIEVLEAELSLYRNSHQPHQSEVNKDSFTFTSVLKKRSDPVQCKNKFDILHSLEKNTPKLCKPKGVYKKINTVQVHAGQTNWHTQLPFSNEKNKVSLPYERLLLYSDSHGRQLGSILTNRIKKDTAVTSFCYPSAGLEQVLPASPPPPRSCCVIMAGANDVADGQANTILRQIEQYLVILLRTSKVLVVTLPFRHDLPSSHPINDSILLVNAYIWELCSRHEGVRVLEINQIDREGFTRHGMHLTRRGKRRLSHMVVAEILKLSQQLTRKTPTTSLNEHHKRRSDDVTSQRKCCINLIDSNMSTVITKHRNNRYVGFAHSISGDFHNPRRMSAGVAVIFRDYFGKPIKMQRLTDHLALQNNGHGASVYSLITKDKYYGKPEVSTYNTAFEHLTTDFKNKGLTHLICSPIGCVRDKIQLPTLISNIKRFQNTTNADVTIVSYDQRSSKKLRNGLSHEEFNKEMKRQIENSNQLTNTCNDPPEVTTTPTPSNNCEDGPSSPSPDAHVQPRVLPHDSYAEAVVNGTSPQSTRDELSPKNYVKLDVVHII